jgi:anti-anti-sigma factor
LSDLNYISSIGLRIFLKVAKALKTDNKKLVLAKPNAVILDLLLMSGFDKIIEIQH